MFANRLIRQGRTKWLEALDQAVSGLASARGIACASVRNFVDYARAQSKLGPNRSPFLLSMQGSIGAFHAALDAGKMPELDAAFGADLVRVCDTIAARVFPQTAPVVLAPKSEAAADVAILGGSGFIGTHLVEALVDVWKALDLPFLEQRILPFRRPADEAAQCTFPEMKKAAE